MIRTALWLKVGLPLVVLGLLGAVVGTLLVGVASISSETTTNGCGLQAGVDLGGTVDPGLLPYEVTGSQSTMAMTGEQTANVATIVGVVKGRGLPMRAAVIAVATSMQESSLRNIDYGDRDSLGLFQQRPSQGWGSRAEILDPVYSTGRFLDSMTPITGWETMVLTEIAQQVQRSGFPLAYSKWETQAAQLVTAAADAPAVDTGAPAVDGPPSGCGLVPAAGGADGPVIPAGLVTVRTWPAETASLDDPTTTGRITPRLLGIIEATKAQGFAGGGITCWDAHAWNPTSDHPTGRACDVFFAHPDPAAIAQGWAYANYLVANQATLGVKYLIWQGQFWQASDPTRWVLYESTIYGCPNPAEITGCHYDHVHVSSY